MRLRNMEASIRRSEIEERCGGVRNQRRFPFRADALLGTTVLGFSNIRLKTRWDCGTVQDKPSCARTILAFRCPAGLPGQAMQLACILAKTVQVKGWDSKGFVPELHVRLMDFARRGRYTGVSVRFR